MTHVLFSLIILSSSVVVTLAQVDASLGSYSCYPCGRALCGFHDGGSDRLIDTSGINENGADRAPSRTCQEIQLLADRRMLDPEVCSIYSQITLSSEDPCDCRKRTRAFAETSVNEKCTNPNQPQACNLCGRNKIIGDPEKFLPDPRYPTTCIKMYDVQQENLDQGGGGFSSGMCNNLQGLFSQHCKCVTPGTPVEQCQPQESLEQECDPTRSDDQCCIGHCRYVHLYRRHFCTFKPADPVPGTPAPTRQPTRPPTNNPTSEPTVSPSDPILSGNGQGNFGNIDFSFDGIEDYINSVNGRDECNPTTGCRDGFECVRVPQNKFASYKCVLSFNLGSSKSAFRGGGGENGETRAKLGIVSPKIHRRKDD